MSQIEFVGGPFDGHRRNVCYPERELLSVIALPVVAMTVVNPSLALHDESGEERRAFYELENGCYRFWGVSAATSAADVCEPVVLEPVAEAEAPAAQSLPSKILTFLACSLLGLGATVVS